MVAAVVVMLLVGLVSPVIAMVVAVAVVVFVAVAVAVAFALLLLLSLLSLPLPLSSSLLLLQLFLLLLLICPSSPPRKCCVEGYNDCHICDDKKYDCSEHDPCAALKNNTKTDKKK